ncbi:hypothetical protein CYLTODRAFT_372999 [Cylindrobasidium torrendii FP15055 ss-10]|uniref:tRNA-splicing endonuclease subunit Sen15 domain-containing protein n=1 Tax=Cylindrobasidium torrendii FP15055 ss-10 TaxID=1314674 RepID=A0A0D7BHY9_9AGAR|nr:hypothetical protein CYLTODRAFT_372999 [Cylindrobasidium torrendii FP15055 ss-10]
MFTPATHPSAEILAPLLSKYPATSSSLFQVYNDVRYAQSWTDVQVVDLGERGAVKGKRSDTDEDEPETSYVVPCRISETISFSWIQEAFSALDGPEAVYLGITADDSSVVYYKLSKGIVKPPL